VLFEFAVENVDAAARRWQAEAGIAGPVTGRYPDVIPLEQLRRALARRFRELVYEPSPYLARERDREDLHDREAAAIADGELNPAGARLALERSG
jgi:hypothetical protein